MTPEIAIAVIGGASGTLLAAALAFLRLAWKIGRWQAQSEERGKAMSKRLDAFIERADESIGDAHKRIDRILDPHV